jgi:hypothetical protein
MVQVFGLGLLAVISFEENGIEENGGSNQGTLLRGSRLLGEVDFKGIGIRKELDTQRFGFLENLAEVRSITIGVFLVGIEDTVGYLATSLSTRISFGKAIDTCAHTASGIMKLVHGLVFSIVNDKAGDTAVELFFNASNGLTIASERCSLVAAALARSDSASARTIDRNHFGIRVEFLDNHFKGVNGVTEHTAATVSIFKRSGNLVATNKVLELRLGVATHEFLTPSAASLTDFHFFTSIAVRFQGIRAAIHCSCLCRSF